MLALAFYQGWWGVRPKSPVTSQPPSFGRSPVSGRSSYTLFHGGLPTALLTIPLRDAVWPLTFMLAHKAVPHACRHLLFTYMCSPRYQLAQTPVSPHGAAGQQKQTPPPGGLNPTSSLMRVPSSTPTWGILRGDGSRLLQPALKAGPRPDASGSCAVTASWWV